MAETVRVTSGSLADEGHLANPRPGLLGMLRAIAVLQPTLFAVARLDGSARWSQDIDVVRTLGGSQIGAEHVVSSALASAMTLLPIGNRVLRVGLTNALVTMAAAWLIFELTLRLLARRRAALGEALLCASAAMLVTNSPAWQLHAGSLGGGAVAVALALGLVWSVMNRSSGSQLAWMHGAWFGLLVIESRAAALATLLALSLLAAARAQLPRLLTGFQALLAACCSAVLGMLPSVVQALRAGGNWRHLGLAIDLPTANSWSASEAFAELGWYVALLAVVGVTLGIVRPRWRVVVAPMLGLALAHLLLERAATGLLMVAGVAAFSSLGARVLVDLLRRAQLPMWRSAIRLLALIHVCALLMVAESARERGLASEVNATRQWSQQAFERLPSRSLLLTNTPEAAWRLWAERLSSGVRPDVLLVPQSLLGHGGLAADLMAAEPALGPLIRDAALDGRSGEYALSQLADVRPLRVEADHHWDKRVLAHCEPDGLWFRFAAHELGRADRSNAIGSVYAATRSVAQAAIAQHGRDEATLTRLRHDLLQQAAVSIALRDRSNARRTLRRLRRLGGDEPLVEHLQGELKQPRSIASIDDLLRSN